jgi:hypothetical protein
MSIDGTVYGIIFYAKRSNAHQLFPEIKRKQICSIIRDEGGEHDETADVKNDARHCRCCNDIK